MPKDDRLADRRERVKRSMLSLLRSGRGMAGSSAAALQQSPRAV